jgi:eukaryotic-like serine/threonine-protein kinase
VAGLVKGSAELPVGELLERAARLARETHEGTIALDGVTRDLLAARFEIDERGLLGGPRGGERRVMGKVVPFVGREKDMAILEATVAEAIEESAPRALLVIARPGTGKSRLAREFVETRLRRRADVTILEARVRTLTHRPLVVIALARPEVGALFREPCLLTALPRCGGYTSGKLAS